ncbi:hypothetical protein LJC19_04075 [Oxalobacter sp. OttesenSCG-928-P03]|nr:hypothetical protein [Oxalobacter sp. OttesenSCG-928-P03]
MYTEEDIQSAIQAGIFTPETADAFRIHVARQKSMPAVDEEHFRLITGFNDIFVVIACSLLLASIVWIGKAFSPALGGLAAAAAAWGLAEFFVRKRRMALPAIVLLLAFVGAIYYASVFLLKGLPMHQVFSCTLAAGAAWLHWRRFRVPITIAAGAAAVSGSAIALILSIAPDSLAWMRIICFMTGVAVFAFAMRWDSADTRRQTRKSDVAFWLHLLAAPLLVHPVFTALDIFSGKSAVFPIAIVMVLYVFIALVSLLIDRRALMVSSLIYVLYAFSTLLEKFGVVNMGFALTALFIGSALLLLSAFWHFTRTQVLRHVPARITSRLPPLK